MENFTHYRPTKVIFGRGTIDSLAQEVGALGHRVLLCYGGTAVRRIGLYDQVVERLKGFEVFELADIAPNPRVSSVREGVATCREHDVDVVVAVGGGSAIDCAKPCAPPPATTATPGRWSPRAPRWPTPCRSWSCSPWRPPDRR